MKALSDTTPGLRRRDLLARAGESPAVYAARLASYYASNGDGKRRRELAQYFTPLDIARFMASLARATRPPRRLLDPGAGTGILACALCETLPLDTGEVHLDAYEVDAELARLCNRALSHARLWLAERGTQLSFTVHERDFVTSNSTALSPQLFDAPVGGSYDIAISNPPYFKLGKAGRQAAAASTIVHGQPNIYAIFMAIAAALLDNQGVMVTITPRSFSTGAYFRVFRQKLFSTVLPEAIHLFDSRKEAFRGDDVLQENVIVKLRRGSHSERVTVSTSAGTSDLEDRKVRQVPLKSVVDIGSRNLVFRIPEDATDDAVIDMVQSWPCTLQQLGLEVSTGPVVAFRARDFLRGEPGIKGETAPLLWLQNVRPMMIQWPIAESRKPQYIVDSRESRALLVTNATYVVLRRFTAKEEHRRLAAAPLLRSQLAGRTVGLENHLNYIHRPSGEISDDEAIGLSGLLGSALVDRYFRVSSGSTQVNAGDLRVLPVPQADVLRKLGEVIRREDIRGSTIEQVVEESLSVPVKLVRALKAKGNGQG